MKANIKSYGVKETNEVASEIDKIVEEIKINGYAVVENVLEPSEAAIARRKLEEIYQTQCEEIGGEETLQQINDANIVRCALAYDEFFLNIAVNPKIRAILDNLLGDYYILQQQNGIINLPNQENYQVSWHRDLPYQHFVSSRPLAVSALVCLDDFSPETGGTYMLPASHKIEKFPSGDFLDRYEVPMQAKAGSALVFDSMIYHRAGHNKSANKRIGLNHAFTLPFIKQQISLPKVLNGKYQENPYLRKFLGYESEVGESVLGWRSLRLNRNR